MVDWCTSDEWAEGSADADWRAAAYERAATRPCFSYMQRRGEAWRPNHCWMVGKSHPGPQSSCASAESVAR